MKVKVGLIGSDLVVKRLFALANKFPDLTVTSYPFKNENETVAIMRKNARKMDIAVFSGPVPYELAKPVLNELNLPAFFVPYDESAVFAMLLSLIYHEKHSLQRISIDIPQEHHVQEVFRETAIPMDDVYVIDYEREFNDERLFQYHYDLWAKGKVELALTCRINVYNRLVSNGVPCLRLVPPVKSMRETMALVNLKSETLLLDLARLAVVNVGFKAKNTWLSYGNEEAIVKIHQVLLPYAKNVGALLSEKSGYVSMRTERKKLEKLTQNFNEIPFLAELKKNLDCDLSIGIGIGWTNYEADQHALIGLQRAKSEDGDSIYLVTENKEVFGSLSSKLSYTLKTTDEDLIEMAQKTNLSVVTLSKLRSIWADRNENSISSEEIATRMDISRRSAQRLLKILVDADMSKIVGEEQPYNKGRPRSLYELRL